MLQPAIRVQEPRSSGRKATCGMRRRTCWQTERAPFSPQRCTSHCAFVAIRLTAEAPRRNQRGLNGVYRSAGELMRQTMTLLGGIGLGAGMAFLLDPGRGARRRALIRDKAVRLWHDAEYAAGKVGRDTRNRAAGLAAEARHLVQRGDDYVSD